MHEVLVNRLGGLSLPRKSVVGLTDRPDMTLDVYNKTTTTTTKTSPKQFANYNPILVLIFVLSFTVAKHKKHVLTLKAPITTAADDFHKYFSLFFRENKT